MNLATWSTQQGIKNSYNEVYEGWKRKWMFSSVFDEKIPQAKKQTAYMSYAREYITELAPI